MGRAKIGWLALGAVAAGALGYACINDDTDVTCPKYCNDIQTTCTGVDQQYPDDPTCERFCAAMDPGEAGVASGDTIACRRLAISSAKDETDPANKHDECASGGIRAGQCTGDDPCVAFCKVDLALCPTNLSGYADQADCVAKCATWGKSIDGQLLGSTGNTLQCRTYHLELSQTGSPDDVTTHCPHTGQDSARCFDADAGGGDAGAGDAGQGDAASDASGD